MTDEMVEADWRKICPGLNVIYENLNYWMPGREADDIMQRIADEFAATRPAPDREAVIEECAKVADAKATVWRGWGGSNLASAHAADHIGAAIRALSPSPAQKGEAPLNDLAMMLRRMIWVARKEIGDTSMKALAGNAEQLLKKYNLEGSPTRALSEAQGRE